MSRFCFVNPGQSTAEVVECAVKLIESNYEQRPNKNVNDHHLFIDREDMAFFFTNKVGLELLLETAPVAFSCSDVVETNLNQIKQWPQRPPRIKA